MKTYDVLATGTSSLRQNK